MLCYSDKIEMFRSVKHITIVKFLMLTSNNFECFSNGFRQRQLKWWALFGKGGRYFQIRWLTY